MRCLVLASIFAIIPYGVPVEAGDCHARVVHHKPAVVVEKAADVVVVKEVYIAALAIPQYSLGIPQYPQQQSLPVGYSTAGPTAPGVAYAPQAAAAPAVGAQDELTRLRARIAELEGRPNGNGVQATDLQSRAVSIFSNRCASCHSNQTAQGRGAGFVLLEGQGLANLNAFQVSKILAKVHKSGAGRMPKNGQPLPQQEKDVISDWADALEVVQQNGNGKQPNGNGQPTNGGQPNGNGQPTNGNGNGQPK